MKKKNGFFSMSIVYSFFLVFSMITVMLLANYAHNRILVKSFNEEIKDELNARGDKKLANFKNLLKNPDFTDEYQPNVTCNQETYSPTSLIGECSPPKDWEIEGAVRNDLVAYNEKPGIKLKNNVTNGLKQKVEEGIVAGETYYIFCMIYTSENVIKYSSSSLYLTDGFEFFYFTRFVSSGGTKNQYDLTKWGYEKGEWGVLSGFVKIPEGYTPPLESPGWYFHFSQTGTEKGNTEATGENFMWIDSFALVNVSHALDLNLDDYALGYAPERDYSYNPNNPPADLEPIQLVKRDLDDRFKKNYFEKKYICNKSNFRLKIS